jgi:hypothetical protein
MFEKFAADPYAVDKYGNMYSISLNDRKETVGAGQFNHSSFCAGKEIVVAGTIAWKDGFLLYISNLSGHYKPSRANLQMYLRSLQDEDVELDNVCIGCFNQTNDGYDHFKFNTFINNPNAQSDWPHLSDGGFMARVAGRLVSNPG